MFLIWIENERNKIPESIKKKVLYTTINIQCKKLFKHDLLSIMTPFYFNQLFKLTYKQKHIQSPMWVVIYTKMNKDPSIHYISSNF